MDWPTVAPLELHAGGVISTSTALMGIQNANATSTAWPTTNLAIFVPIRTPVPVTICKLVVGAGATATGNFDVGIYDAAGNRLVSAGATAKGASTEHVIDIADTTIGPGTYYLGMSCDGTINMIMFASTLQGTKLSGVVQMATAYVLPATATYASAANAMIPAIAAYLRPF